MHTRTRTLLIVLSGMWGLEVSHNPVTEIPSMAFYGLERALWELHLTHNRLTRIPAESIAPLRKLSVLNLSGKTFTITRFSEVFLHFLAGKYDHPDFTCDGLYQHKQRSASFSHLALP